MKLHSVLPWRKPAPTAVTWDPSPREPEVLIGGRRHLNGVPYLLPKDLPEAGRLDFQHHLLYGLLKTHYCAPLRRDMKDLLDVGCGTGRWAWDMAKIFPHTQVLAFDLEAPPQSSYRPSANYRFVRGDLFAGLPFEAESFDYVHQRLMVAAIPEAQWLPVLRDLLRVTRLGGYVELVEAGDNYMNAGPMMQRFLQWGREMGRTHGMDFALVAGLDALLCEAGGKQAQKRVIQAPIGQWGGRIGDMLARNMYAAFACLRGPYEQALGLPPEQFDTTLKALPQERRTVLQLYVFYGQCQ